MRWYDNSTERRMLRPALFTSTSTDPCSRRTSLAIRSMSSISDRSHACTKAAPHTPRVSDGGERGAGPPAWLPASVGSAARRAVGSDDDLFSGRAWSRLVESLGRAGDVLLSDRTPVSAVEQASGYRHLLVLLALGIDEALRSSNPYDPHIRPGNVDAVLKWGMDCPDAFYSGASVRGDAVYRVSGRRGT